MTVFGITLGWPHVVLVAIYVAACAAPALLARRRWARLHRDHQPEPCSDFEE